MLGTRQQQILEWLGLAGVEREPVADLPPRLVERPYIFWARGKGSLWQTESERVALRRALGRLRELGLVELYDRGGQIQIAPRRMKSARLTEAGKQLLQNREDVET